MPIIKKFTRDLPCVLTEAEVATKAAQLVEFMHEKRVEADAFDEIRRAHKKKMADLEMDSGVLAIEVRNQREDREVDCQEILNREAGTVEMVRMDTGEKIGERQATPSEIASKSILFASPGKTGTAGE